MSEEVWRLPGRDISKVRIGKNSVAFASRDITRVRISDE